MDPSRYSSLPALIPFTMKSRVTPYSFSAVTSLRVAPLRFHSPSSAIRHLIESVDLPTIGSSVQRRWRIGATASLEFLARAARARLISSHLRGSNGLAARWLPVRISPIGSDDLQNDGQSLHDRCA